MKELALLHPIGFQILFHRKKVPKGPNGEGKAPHWDVLILIIRASYRPQGDLSSIEKRDQASEERDAFSSSNPRPNHHFRRTDQPDLTFLSILLATSSSPHLALEAEDSTRRAFLRGRGDLPFLLYYSIYGMNGSLTTP